ncbi:MAG: Clp protease N-terminal domain-containing protein, partial [Candidatus Promineifilaceae bacterium]
MNTLNPNIPSPELSKLMTTASARRSEYGQKLLTPQLLLRTLLDEQKTAGYQILAKLSQQRGFDFSDLTRRVDMMAKHAAGRDAKFNFTDDFGEDVGLSEEMLVVLDEALSIAQARDELKAGSGHALAAMAQHNVTTYAVLQRVGVTAAAVTALLGDVAKDGSAVIRDFIDEA